MAYNYEYPYTDISRVNSDWIIKRICELSKEYDEFVIRNEIKYADPIQWNVTSQYEKYTIVTNDNTAYLSKRPIPSGISITNTDYWLKIADFSGVFEELKYSIAIEDDGGSTTSTKDRTTGELVWLNNLLYKVLRDINVGDSYVIDGTNPNVANVSIEELLNEYVEMFKEADSDILDGSSHFTQFNYKTPTTINKYLKKVGYIDENGDEYDLLVANTDVEELVGNYYANVKDYGAIGDGVTDDYNAIMNAIENSGKSYIFFPSGTYLIGNTLDVPSFTTIFGTGDTTFIKITDSSLGNGIELNHACVLRDISISGDSTAPNNLVYVKGNGVTINHCLFTNFTYSAICLGDFTSNLIAINPKITDCNFRDSIVETNGGSSILVSSVGFAEINKCAMSERTGSSTQQTYGIRIVTGDTIILSDCNITKCGIALAIDVPANMHTYSIYATNCLFDSGRDIINGRIDVPGCEIKADNGSGVYNTRFTNCWFGLCSGYGVNINATGTGITDTIEFDSCDFSSNGSDGILLTKVKNITINGGTASDNSYGLRMYGECENVNINSFRSGDTKRGTNDHGIYVVSGSTINNLIINGCNLTGNTYNALYNDGGTITNEIVTNNLPITVNETP